MRTGIELEPRFFNFTLPGRWFRPAYWKLSRKILEPCLVIRCDWDFMSNRAEYGVYHPAAPIVEDGYLRPNGELIYAETDDRFQWAFQIGDRPIFGAAFILKEHLT